jgi:hypothetical protein
MHIIKPLINFELHNPSSELIAGECSILNNTESDSNLTEIADNGTGNYTVSDDERFEKLEAINTENVTIADEELNLTLNDYNTTNHADNIPPAVYFHNIPAITNQSILNISWSAHDENLSRAELYVNENLTQRKSVNGSYHTYVLLSEGLNRIELTVYDVAGNTNHTTLNVTLDTQPPEIEPLAVIYPVGVISARPGDEVIVRVFAGDSGVGLNTLTIKSAENIPGTEMLENSDYFRLVRDTGNASHFAVIDVPSDIQADFSCTVSAIDKAGNSANVTFNISVSQSLLAFNLEFMPGVNLISLPIIPENPDVEKIFSDTDFIESIWAYDANTSTWSVYTPGEAPDTLTELKTGYGYRVLTNKSTFTKVRLPNSSSEVPLPIKVSYNGSYLKPAQLPPVYRLYRGWNLIGFHSEVKMVADEYLAGLTYPEKIWSSLLTYENYADFENNRFVNGRVSSVGQNDYLEPGRGYWIYVEQDGLVTP